MIRLPISLVQPGMVCATPVRHATVDSQVLLQGNQALASDTISRLAGLGVSAVWVRHPRFDFLDEQLRDDIVVCRTQMYQAIKEIFTGVAERTRGAFDHVQCRTAVSNLILTMTANRKSAVLAESVVDGQQPLFAHCSNTAYLALVIGMSVKDYIFAERKFASYSDATDLTNLGVGAMLHDLGKLALDPPWHNVHGFDEQAQSDEYRSHVDRGYRAVQGRVEASASQILLHHHQRFDGGGFPQNPPRSKEQQHKPIEGSGIHVFSRIVAVANTIDGLIARCREQGRPMVAALHRIQSPELAGAFDPVILDAALRTIPPYPLGTFVELSDGRSAVVTDLNEAKPCQPKVRELPSPADTNGRGAEEIDLSNAERLTIVKVDGLPVGDAFYTLPEQSLKRNTEMPGWLRAALDGEATDVQLNSRREPRRVWVVRAKAKRLSAPTSRPLIVQTLNVSRTGVGFIAGQQLLVGERLDFSPQGEAVRPARVRVVHCTQITQGFQVGCVFEHV